MRHAFVHFDLNTSDFAGVRRFYEALFEDWRLEDVQAGVPQAEITTPSGPSGGLQPTHSRGARSQWVPYVAVDDLRATLARVREAGGAVIQDYVEVAGVGAQAIVQDPGGTQLGLLEMTAELARARSTFEEVVEPEVIEDAEIIEEESGPAVVVDAPARVEITVGPKKRGRRRAAVAAEAEVAEVAEVAPEVEAEVVEAEVVEAEPVEEERGTRGRRGFAKKAAGKKPATEPQDEVEAEDEVAPAPSEKRSRRGSRVEAAASDDAPVAKKRTARKATSEEPAKAAEEPAVARKTARKTAKKAADEPPVARRSAKKAEVEEPAAVKKTTKKAAVEEAAPAKKTTKKAAVEEPAPAKKTTKKAAADEPATAKAKKTTKKVAVEEPVAAKKATTDAPAPKKPAEPAKKTPARGRR